MKKILFLFLSIFCICTTGCRAYNPSPGPSDCRVVTEIEIQTNQAAPCNYRDPRKISKTLHYLRRLDPWDRPDRDPEACPGDRYRITLRFSDGGIKTYDQIACDYLREDNGPWREVSPKYALRLSLLLAAVPSDGNS